MTFYFDTQGKTQELMSESQGHLFMLVVDDVVILYSTLYVSCLCCSHDMPPLVLWMNTYDKSNTQKHPFNLLGCMGSCQREPCLWIPSSSLYFP